MKLSSLITILLLSSSSTVLSQTVTGTGTLNYVPKFTGASILGNSTIYDNGTSVGIGTTTPGAKLDLLGVAQTGSAAVGSLNIAQTWNTTGNPSAIKLNVTNTLSGAASLLFDLQVNNASVFSINKTGYLSTLGGSINVLSTTDISTDRNINMGGVSSANRNIMAISSGKTWPRFGLISVDNTIFYSEDIFNPTSGVGSFTAFKYVGQINQTGGNTAITRGLLIAPTLTAASNWRSIEFANNIGFGLYGSGTAKNYLQGNLLIGTTTDAGYKLNVAGDVYSSGKVLIGTSGLAIGAYSLAVNGSAIFTKAVVKLNTSWPDYVFDKNYTLLPLAEVEKFLHKNKHLPEVPSADEVIKNGIDLGDNQTILLKKVEELTIYLIEQNKKLEQQGLEISNLQKQLNRLQKGK